MSGEKKDSKLQRGVLVEFDFAVMPGHEIMLQICKERLAEAGLKIDNIIMARYMFGRSFVSGLSALCRAQNVSSVELSELATTCNELFAQRAAERLNQIPQGFNDFIDALVKKGLKPVLFSKIDTELLRASFSTIAEEKLGISEDLTSSFCFTSWEGWRRFARKNNLHERLCVAVAGSGLSVKGALTSGLSVLVKTNPIADYQDISGCDKKIDKFSAEIVKDVVDMLHL
jgi:hypothetical protein